MNGNHADNTENTPMPTLNAFLVRLQISQWSPRKLDKHATNNAKEHAGATDKAKVKVYKTILAAKELEHVASIASSARAEHEKRTVPWQYKGPGAISSSGYAEYKTCIDSLRDEFFKAVCEFLAVYTRERDNAKSYLGDLFNEDDYPALEDITAKFDFDLICEPMPQAEDFRVGGLSEDELKEIQSDMESRLKETLANAQNEAWDRVIDHIIKLKTKIDEYKPSSEKGKKTEGRFHDTLVENLRELITLLPSLNITGDSNLTYLGEQIEKELLIYTAPELRDSELARADVSKKAKAVLDHVESMRADALAA